MYKLIYKELLAYICLYLAINLAYRLVLVANSECDAALPTCQYVLFAFTHTNLNSNFAHRSNIELYTCDL